jgi:hypothetical protein
MFRTGSIQEADLTSFKGYAPKQTLENLTRKLGLPNTGSADGKVTCEWVIVGADGTVATVYDWKTGRTPHGEYDWHIGGHSHKAVDLILSILKD